MLHAPSHNLFLFPIRMKAGDMKGRRKLTRASHKGTKKIPTTPDNALWTVSPNQTSSNVHCREVIHDQLFHMHNEKHASSARTMHTSPHSSVVTMAFVTLLQQFFYVFERSCPTLYLSKHSVSGDLHSISTITMKIHSSRNTLTPNSSSNLSSNPQRTKHGKSANSKIPNCETTPTVWKCATCGRRYEEPATPGPFITPPPTTECIIVQTEETFTHEDGGFVNLILTGGATCDYVRVKHVLGETDLSGQLTEPEEAYSAMNVPTEQSFLSRAHGNELVQVERGRGRVRKLSGAVRATWDEEDYEDSEFWKTRCNDVDCIFKGHHYRYQCAMAEMDEEPGAKAPASKQGLRFLR